MRRFDATKLPHEINTSWKWKTKVCHSKSLVYFDWVIKCILKFDFSSFLFPLETNDEERQIIAKVFCNHVLAVHGCTKCHTSVDVLILALNRISLYDVSIDNSWAIDMTNMPPDSREELADYIFDIIGIDEANAETYYYLYEYCDDD